MQNINMEVKGDKLTIVVDLSKSHGNSKSGKSVVIATTGGNADVPGKSGIKIGLNIYRKAD